MFLKVELISMTDSRRVNAFPLFREEWANADVSLGKHIPPNPIRPSGPGAIICEFPIRGSNYTNSVSISKSTSPYISRSWLKNITLVAKKQLIVYFA